MKNKEIKKNLINKGTFKEYRKQRFQMFKNKEYEKLDDYKNYFDENGVQFDELTNQCCYELKQARKKQIQKIRRHIIYWLANDYKIFFGTFSYDDKKRKKEIKEETLKKYVLRTISNISDDYIINIDYGRENERLHYHCLLAIKENNFTNEFTYESVKRNKGTREKPIWVKGDKLIHSNFKEYENNVGFYDMEPCKDDEESAKKLSRYIDKLTLHSIKVKQNYVSVKKGTEYQQVKLIRESINKQVNHEKEFAKTKEKLISTETYLKGLYKVEQKVNVPQYIENEYYLLNQKRDEKQKRESYLLKLKKERWHYDE